MKLKFTIAVLFFIFSFNSYGADCSKLYNAVKNNNIENLKNLLKENNTNINCQYKNGETPLMTAVYMKNINAVKLLVENNADVNIQDNRKNSPFLYAGANGYLDIVKLIYKKAKVNSVFNIYGGNALIPASEKGHKEMVKFLLENTAVNVNHINNLSWTALLEVTILGEDTDNYAEISELLLKHGADINIKDNTGKTAYDYAKEKNMTKILNVFQKYINQGNK